MSTAGSGTVTNMPTTPIKLICRGCGKTMDYDRAVDPAIPATVAIIEQPSCDECWHGDREGEFWFDADGQEVSQAQPTQPTA